MKAHMCRFDKEMNFLNISANAPILSITLPKLPSFWCYKISTSELSNLRLFGQHIPKTQFEGKLIVVLKFIQYKLVNISKTKPLLWLKLSLLLLHLCIILTSSTVYCLLRHLVLLKWSTNVMNSYLKTFKLL